MTPPLVVERRVDVPAEKVFRFFADGGLWMQWQGVDAEIDLRPGGTFRVNVTGDGYASGRFVEIVENRKVVFTWGWERAGSLVPPGSSTVVIDLLPSEGGTLIRLTHSGLPEDELEVHRQGWENYLGRLASVAAGIDPGPDPFAAA
ncbi:MAG: SRPBCC family protein [Actinomycetota bacterium]